MCITEEDFRLERKRAMEVLEELKILEQSLDLVTVKIDAKTVRSTKKQGDAHKHKRRIKYPSAEMDFFDFSLGEFFEDPLCEGPDIF